MLFPRGAVSLRALRELVQIRLNVSLVGRRSDIRRLAKKAAEEFSCGDRRIDGYAPVWEPLPKHSCLDRTWAPDVAASDTKDRGRCLFSSLSDFGHGTIDNLEAKFQKAELLGTRHVVGDLGGHCLRKPCRRLCSGCWKTHDIAGTLTGFLPPSIRAANDVFCKVLISSGLAEQLGSSR